MNNIKELTTKLELDGYKIKRISGSQIDIVVDGDRVQVLMDIAKKYKGKYNPKGGQSSIGRTEIKSFKINVKPAKGGGSGAGSAITDLAESAACLYAAAAWEKQPYTKMGFQSVKSNIDITASIDEVLKLPDQWINSSIKTAEKLKSEYGNKKYTFHRGSSWVQKLENHFKKLNREEREFANPNKWSPADIYMVSKQGERIDLTKSNNILELNNMILKAAEDGDIIPVSLKQIGPTVKFEKKNFGTSRYSYNYESFTVGKRSFFASNDAYIKYDGGEIQFRTFGSTWQGEIKGKFAAQGKISGGPINNIMRKNGIKIKEQNQIKDMNSELIKEFYTYYKGVEGNNALNEKEFMEEVNKKDYNWYISKFLSTQFVYKLLQQDQKTRNKIVSQMLLYAASESELSAPYIKVS